MLPGFRVLRKFGICNTHANLGSVWSPASINKELLDRFDFTHVTRSSRSHNRVLRYTGLDAAEGNPMQAWYIVYWTDEDGNPATAGERDTLYTNHLAGKAS